jgi:hypothetical protein
MLFFSHSSFRKKEEKRREKREKGVRIAKNKQGH